MSKEDDRVVRMVDGDDEVYTTFEQPTEKPTQQELDKTNKLLVELGILDEDVE